MGVERLGAFPSYARMLLLLSMLASIAPISIDMYLPAFANLQRDFHASEEAVQGTLGAYMLCYALMLLLYGGMSDAVGRRPVLLWSSAVYALGAIGAALAPTLEYFYVGRMVQGMSAGAGVVIAQAIVRDCYSGQRAQQAMSYLIIIISLSPALAPVVGGYMVQYSSWRLVFATLCCWALLAWLLCWRYLPETLAPEQVQRFSLQQWFQNAQTAIQVTGFLRLSLAQSLIVAAQGLLIGFAPHLLQHLLALPDSSFGGFFIPLALGGMIGAFLAAHLRLPLGGTGLIILGYGLMAGAGVGLMVLLSQPALQFIWISLVSAVFTMGMALSMPTLTLFTLRSQPHSGLAVSVLGFLQMLAFAVSSGWGVSVFFINPAWLGVGLVTLVGMSCVIWFSVTTQPIRAEP